MKAEVAPQAAVTALIQQAEGPAEGRQVRRQSKEKVNTPESAQQEHVGRDA